MESVEKQKDWSNNLNQIEEPENDKFSFLEFIWDLIKTAVIVIVIAFGIKYFIVQPFIVDGNSMLPNFENNEYLLVEKISYHLHQPERGDVIVFHPPGQNDQNYIKRVIGLPGETVEITNNQVKIINSDHPDGVILTENYLPPATKTTGSSLDTKVSLSKDEYFVMGDNREHSSDSREWGALPKSNIIGRSWLNVYPFENFGIIAHQKFSL